MNQFFDLLQFHGHAFLLSFENMYSGYCGLTAFPLIQPDIAVVDVDAGFGAHAVVDLAVVERDLRSGDIDAAETWADRVGAVLTARAIPGTLPAIDHGRGLVLLARGDVPAAGQALESASASWRAQRRFWEGTWARLDLASAAARARRPGAAAVLLAEVRADASPVGAAVLTAAADQLAQSFGAGRPAEPWHPLSAREFEVAQLIAAGLTNRQIAEQLVLAPKTISAHVTHILTKLGAARRAEIAAWCATVRQDPA